MKPEYYNQILAQINNETKNLYGFSTDVVDQSGRKFKRLFVVQRFALREAIDVREKLLRSKVVDEGTITPSLIDIRDQGKE